MTSHRCSSVSTNADTEDLMRGPMCVGASKDVRITTSDRCPFISRYNEIILPPVQVTVVLTTGSIFTISPSRSLTLSTPPFARLSTNRFAACVNSTQWIIPTDSTGADE